jgi:hypothetical protein
MKLKLNLSASGIKPLAMQHGEKALFGCAVLALVMFIWSAAKTDVLGPDKQPEKLKEAAEKSDQWVLGSKWKGVEVVDYVKRAKRDPLNDRDYRLAVFFDKPLWESKGLRPDPKVLPIEELMASAGLGIFSLNVAQNPAEAAPAAPPRRRGPVGGPPVGPPGGGPLRGMPPGADPALGRPGATELKGMSWVVVTGLVPLAKQDTEFEEAFHNVQFNDPDQDFPEFFGLRIERAEVQDESAAPAWQPMNLASIQKTLKSFHAMAPELVDEEFTDPNHTMPLGPMVGAEWTFDVVGHPKVKLAEKPGTRAVRPEVAAAEPAEDEDEAGGVGLVDPNRPRADFGAPPNIGPRPVRRQGRLGVPKRKQSDSILFRVIDYTVEPGKQYRYRVQRRLLNPNRGVAEKWLKDPATRTKKIIESPWSEPTPAVMVPRDIELFAGAVTKPGARDLQVKVLIKKLDRERGMQLTTEGTFARGSLINVDKPKIEIGGVAITDALLDSNSVLIDLRGGGRLSIKDKSLTEPAELMILQPDGSLVVRDELDDEEAYQENTAVDPAKKGKTDGPAVVPRGNPYDDMKKPKGDAAPLTKKKKHKKAPRPPADPKAAKAAKATS